MKKLLHIIVIPGLVVACVVYFLYPLLLSLFDSDITSPAGSWVLLLAGILFLCSVTFFIWYIWWVLVHPENKYVRKQSEVIPDDTQ